MQSVARSGGSGGPGPGPGPMSMDSMNSMAPGPPPHPQSHPMPHHGAHIPQQNFYRGPSQSSAFTRTFGEASYNKLQQPPPPRSMQSGVSYGGQPPNQQPPQPGPPPGMHQQEIRPVSYMQQTHPSGPPTRYSSTGPPPPHSSASFGPRYPMHSADSRMSMASDTRRRPSLLHPMGSVEYHHQQHSPSISTRDPVTSTAQRLIPPPSSSHGHQGGLQSGPQSGPSQPPTSVSSGAQQSYPPVSSVPQYRSGAVANIPQRTTTIPYRGHDSMRAAASGYSDREGLLVHPYAQQPVIGPGGVPMPGSSMEMMPQQGSVSIWPPTPPHSNPSGSNTSSSVTIIRHPPNMAPVVSYASGVGGPGSSGNFGGSVNVSGGISNSGGMPVSMVQPPSPSPSGSSGVPPSKKPRLSNFTPGVEPRPELRQPLHVDIWDGGSSEKRPDSHYSPQVEAISPTLPGESLNNLRDESPMHSHKEELLSKISKVDREIALAESLIAKLKKKLQEVEEATKKGEPEETEKEPKEPKHLSTRQKIYAENKRKSTEAHKSLLAFGPVADSPLYNCPWDNAIYHENKRHYQQFKSRLMEHIRKKRLERDVRETALSEKYRELASSWHNRVEKAENSVRRKSKDAKHREIFEKVFPELRKQREDKERFSRVGARVKSDADMEEIMDTLEQQEMEEKKARQLGVIPPALLTKEERRWQEFKNNNGIITDAMKVYEERKFYNTWTENERDIFKEKYLLHPKNFTYIGLSLERKSVMDCVQYYYQSKKKENYKQLVRKSRVRSRTRAQGNKAALDLANTAPGVTTRAALQAAAAQLQQQQQQQAQQSESRQDDDKMDLGEAGMEEGEEKADKLEGEGMEVDEPDKDGSAPPAASSAPPSGGKRKRERQQAGNAPRGDSDSSDEDLANEGKGGPHSCVVCKAQLEHFGQSRPFPSADAPLHGMNSEEIPPDARVCTNCRCRSVRRRHAPTCPIPTCSKPRWRVKGLRHFPPKWHQVAMDLKEAIEKELQIPENCSKCCASCFNRIARKIGAQPEPGNPNSQDERTNGGGGTGSSSQNGENGVGASWSEEEITKMKDLLKEHGMNWSFIANELASFNKPDEPTKTAMVCKKFYNATKDKHGFAEIVSVYKKCQKEAGLMPPSVTDEEESGSSTSSADEPMGARGPSSNATAGPNRGAEFQPETPEEGKEAGKETGNLVEGSTSEVTAPDAPEVPNDVEDKPEKTPLQENSEPQTPVEEDEKKETGKEDEDSSATQASADEGGSSSAKGTPVKGAGQNEAVRGAFSRPPGGLPQPPPATSPGPAQRQTIRLKDVIDSTITQTLNKPASPRPQQAKSPTLTSILGTERGIGSGGSPGIVNMAGNIGPRKVTTSAVPPVPLPPASVAPSMPPQEPSPPKQPDAREAFEKPPSSEAPMFRPPGLPQEGLAAMQVHQINMEPAPRPQAPPMPSVVTVTPMAQRPPGPPVAPQAAPQPIESDADQALDFSVKKRSSPPLPPTREPLVLRRPPQQHPPTSEPPPAHSNTMPSARPPPDFNDQFRTSSPYQSSSMFARRSPLLPEAQGRSRQASPHGGLPIPKPLPAGKLMMPASGSITHGTPINTAQLPVPVPVGPPGPGSMVHPPRFDGMREEPGPPLVSGSIRHGTPKQQMPMRPPQPGEFYPRHGAPPMNPNFIRQPYPGAYGGPGGQYMPGHPDAQRSPTQQQMPPQQMAHPHGHPHPHAPHGYPQQRPSGPQPGPSYAGHPGSGPPGPSETQMSRKDMLMSDFITSQQMGSTRRDKDGRIPISPRSAAEQGQPPPPQSPASQGGHPSQMEQREHGGRPPSGSERYPVYGYPPGVPGAPSGPYGYPDRYPPMAPGGAPVKRETREWVTQQQQMIRSPVPMAPGHPHGLPRGIPPPQQEGGPPPPAQSHSPLNTLVDVAVAQRDRDRERERDREKDRETEREGLERTMAESLNKRMYAMGAHGQPMPNEDPRYSHPHERGMAPGIPAGVHDMRGPGHGERYQPLPRFPPPSSSAMAERYKIPNSARESFTHEQFDKRLRQDGPPPQQQSAPPMHHGGPGPSGAQMMGPADMRKQYPPRSGDGRREDDGNLRGPPFPHGFVGEGGKQQPGPPRGPTPNPESSTITAANLIDAIITKQINMEMRTGDPAEMQKNSDEFFRKYGQPPSGPQGPQQPPQSSPHMQAPQPPQVPSSSGPGPSGYPNYARENHMRPQLPDSREEEMRKNGPGRPMMMHHQYQLPPPQQQQQQQQMHKEPPKARMPVPSPQDGRKDMQPQPGYGRPPHPQMQQMQPQPGSSAPGPMQGQGPPTSMAPTSQGYSPGPHPWKLKKALQYENEQRGREQQERERQAAAAAAQDQQGNLAPDERQIIRVAQAGSPRMNAGMPMNHAGYGKPPGPYKTEPISPPERGRWTPDGRNRYPGPPRQPGPSYQISPVPSHEAGRFQPGPGNPGGPPPQPGSSKCAFDEYVCNKITEVMRTSEDNEDKRRCGPSQQGPGPNPMQQGFMQPPLSIDTRGPPTMRRPMSHPQPMPPMSPQTQDLRRGNMPPSTPPAFPGMMPPFSRPTSRPPSADSRKRGMEEDGRMVGTPMSRSSPAGMEDYEHRMKKARYDRSPHQDPRTPIPDSPQSGEMIIDESMPRSSPKDMHMQKMPYNPGMFPGGPGPMPNQYYMYQQMPVRSMPSGSPSQGPGQHMPPTSMAHNAQGHPHAKYEPLSDEENN